MSEERIMQQGRLAELRKQAQELKIRIKGHKDTLRIKVLDYVKPDDLESEIILDQAIQLRDAHIEYLSVTQEMTSIEKALGR